MADRQNGVRQPNTSHSRVGAPHPRAPGVGQGEGTHPPQSEEAEQRRARRLADDLGVNSAGVQVVLRLRHMVITLQARVRQLESELRIERSRSDNHFAGYRREYDEATWEDSK